jgi:hypothetical protein
MVEVEELLCRGVPGEYPLIADLAASIRSALHSGVGASSEVARPLKRAAAAGGAAGAAEPGLRTTHCGGCTSCAG